MSILLASTGCFLLYIGLALCIAQGLKPVWRRYPVYRSHVRPPSARE